MKEEIKRKIQALIKEMTLEEKIGMIHGCGGFRTAGVDRIGIPPLYMSDGPMGVRNEFHNDIWKPIGLSDDYVTYFPSNMAIASTWNVELAYLQGEALGKEARGRGKDVILGPGCNIVRSPLCGRNFEYISEDPFLVSHLVVPTIKGIQTQDVAACVKHFALNNQETKRREVSVEVSDQALHEIYLKPFKDAVEKGNSYTIMGAYNKYKGVYCCENDFLLNQILKKEWEFDGVVISDWGAVHHTIDACLHGLDIEMDTDSRFDEYYFAKPLLELVKQGIIDEVVIDEKIRRILELMYKLKIFDDNRKKGAYNIEKNRSVALKVARESVILLKNDNGFLPIDERKYNFITIIGDNAVKLHANGGGSAAIKALYEISPLMGIKMKLGGNTRVDYVPGYSSEDCEEDLLTQAVEVAAKSPCVILFVGLNHDYDTEGKDRLSLSLPYNQDILIREILRVNPNTVVVNISGSPISMESWIDIAPSVVHSFYNGIEGGYALAEVLFGEVNPSGKLPITFAKKLEDYPSHCIGVFPGDEKVQYKEGIFVGYRHFDRSAITPRFPFGHGLSYSEFTYHDLELEDNLDKINVSLTLRNDSEISGKETIQLYVSYLSMLDTRPTKELKAFKKVYLEAHEEKYVNLEIDKNDLAYYDEVNQKWVLVKGECKVLIGSSSQDIRLESTVRVT